MMIKFRCVYFYIYKSYTDHRNVSKKKLVTYSNKIRTVALHEANMKMFYLSISKLCYE